MKCRFAPAASGRAVCAGALERPDDWSESMELGVSKESEKE
jgi:hypothetical protein